MLKKTHRKFSELSTTAKTMVYLFWAYMFGEIIVGLFLSALIFIKTESLVALGVYNLVDFIGIFLGFVAWGYITAQRGLSMRANFFSSFILYTISFIILLIFQNTYSVYLVFSFIRGLSAGIFWLCIHSYEMVHIQDSKRDFYSSMLSLGTQFLSIIAPLVATVSFFFAEHIFQARPFIFLFALLPLVYTGSLLLVYKLPDFVPKRITKKDTRYLLFNKTVRPVRRLYAAQTATIVAGPILSVISIVTFITLINLGLFETVIGVVSLFSITLLSHLRHEGNRAQILFWSALSSVGAYGILFFWQSHILFFLAFSLLIIVIAPIYHVSQHTIDLKSVDILKRGVTSFYPALLYRDALLGIWRFIILGGFILAAFFVKNDIFMIQAGIVYFILVGMLEWRAARKMLAHSTP